jgi:hypothetical protein
MHTDVTDQGAAGSGPIDFVNIQELQFADQTLSVHPLTFTNGQSLTAPEQQVEAMYVAYFGRAGDVAGTNFWTTNLETGQTIDNVAANFAKQVESESLYPFLQSPSTATTANEAAFVESIYQNLFNRAADTSAGQDIATFQNKVTVASYFTNQLAIQNVPYANNQPAVVDAQAHQVVALTGSAGASVATEQAAALVGITNDPHAM